MDVMFKFMTRILLRDHVKNKLGKPWPPKVKNGYQVLHFGDALSNNGQRHHVIGTNFLSFFKKGPFNLCIVMFRKIA